MDACARGALSRSLLSSALCYQVEALASATQLGTLRVKSPCAAGQRFQPPPEFTAPCSLSSTAALKAASWGSSASSFVGSTRQASSSGRRQLRERRRASCAERRTTRREGPQASLHGADSASVSSPAGASQQARSAQESGNAVGTAEGTGLEGGAGSRSHGARHSRRMLLGMTLGVLGAAQAVEVGLAQAAAGANQSGGILNPMPWLLGDMTSNPAVAAAEKGRESRVYDATQLGEPIPFKGKEKVWQRLMGARVVYLGEAEGVPDATDKALELEVVKKLRDECFQQHRPVTLGFACIPRQFQPQLNYYQEGSLSEESLRGVLSGTWSQEQWEANLPLLRYSKQGGVRLYALGAPAEILRRVQARGVQALSAAERKQYVPPPGNPGLITKALVPVRLDSMVMPPGLSADSLPNASLPMGPGPYRFAQARIVADHTVAQGIGQAMADGSVLGMLVVIAGASHVRYGTRGRGIPALVVSRLKKRTQLVVLLNPERQLARHEGTAPEADFLWYSGQHACRRNCFDRAEVARVMGAAGRRREALPQDIQAGLDYGLIAPDTLKSFFELDSQPLLAEATHRFQGLRERWLADPRFLQRLCIEEAISVTTTLIAQYEKRRENFWGELEYVITDTTRGAVVDFFTVWLPAPTLSFRNLDPTGTVGTTGLVDGLQGLLGSLPDNAFQRATRGESWGLGERVFAVVVGGLKLSAVGFVSSIGTVAVSNGLMSVRQHFNPSLAKKSITQRPPVVKTALVYGGFLGTSATLRYQAIAGLVEHWGADYLLAGNPVMGAALSFIARTANSYWGTGQWVDLARKFGLQVHKAESPTPLADGGPAQTDIPSEVSKSTGEELIEYQATPTHPGTSVPVATFPLEGGGDPLGAVPPCGSSPLVPTSASVKVEMEPEAARHIEF